MLIGIPKILPPELLYVLARMGHGDEIILADANFPGERVNNTVIRCDGSEIADLLTATLELLPLDQTVKSPWAMMQATDSNNYDSSMEKQYFEIINRFSTNTTSAEKIERFEFYQRAASAFAVVMTGTAKRFGNIILKKGTVFQ